MSGSDRVVAMHGATSRAPRRFEVTELPRALRAQAVEVLAGAFLHDPAWVAIGPRRVPARRRLLERYYDVLVGEGLRWGGPNWCVIHQRSVVGVALTYANGLRFPPPRATLHEAPPFLLAGPGPGLRGAWVDSVMKRRHPHHEHLLLWYLAAHTSLQRQGIGRALLDHIRSEASRARRPIYLDTTKPENVLYYESQGYRQIGHTRLLRGATAWFMHHDTPAVANDQPG
jgi:GNAT superfamily N-acetyltransferase